MKPKILVKILYGIFSLILMNSVLTAQVSDKVSNVLTGEAKEGQPLDIKIEMQQGASLSNVTIFYRSFGQTEYKQKEMILSGTSASIQIPSSEVILPYIEYYLRIETTTGLVETYPLGLPNDAAPIQIPVSAMSTKDKEVLILSPGKGELITLEDLFISISLLKASDNINPIATKLYLDDIDVTPMAVFAGELILLYPENFPGTISTGSHSLRVELYDNDGELYHSLLADFQVVTDQFAREMSRQFVYRGSVEGESRNESFNDESTWFNNLSLNVNSSYSGWDLNAYGYITSEEKKYLQPQNRFLASLKSEWLELKIGDSYPKMPSLILDGKRVRGVSGGINFGFFNLEATYGEVTRNVEGRLISPISRSGNILASNVIEIDSMKYGLPFGEVNFGTYSREIFAVRPSFGEGENFKFGLSYMHSKDDAGSIEFGPAPKENVVFGTDLFVGLDDNKITFSGQLAASIINNDISNGSFSDSQIDSVFGGNNYISADPEDIKKIKDYLGPFITVNQYLSPLNPQEFASVAGEAAISLNYFYNNIRATYIYRGNDFYSFGQSYLTTDVKGINITDRIRMFDNKVFLSLGYEKLEDNLQETKFATTTYETFNTSLSVFPRIDFPNITIGYSFNKNNNGLSVADTVTQLYAVEDATDKIMASLSYNVDTGIRHNTTLSIMSSTRQDNSIHNIDANYLSTSLSVNSFWTGDFTSYFNIIYYDSEIGGSEYSYTSVTVGGKLMLLENTLQLNASISPSFGDFERQAFDFTSEYFIYENFSLLFQARLYRIPDKSTNSIIGLTTRIAF